MTDGPKVALITGGEGDLAHALAEQLRAAGWLVHAPSHAQMDVTQADAVSAWFSSLQRLDLLVNNAAVVQDGPFARMADTSLSHVVETNLTGAFRCARAALTLMTRQGSGHIVNLGSYAARVGTLGQASYAAAKAGLMGLTQSVAQEYGAQGVRCNCVLPGFLDTRMTRGMPEKRRAEVMAQHVLGRLNTVEDAARFILCLDSFPHISGQVFQLDSRISPWV